MEAHRPAAAATRRRATTVRRGICYSRSMLSPLLPGPPVPPLFASSVDDRGNARTTRVRPNDPVSADPLTILVVDDDPANLALAQALLEAEGYNVWGATDGKSMGASPLRIATVSDATWVKSMRHHATGKCSL